jgi:hypothetical protein
MVASPSLETLQREYGTRITAVEPGDAEPIPIEERHGGAYQQAWIWTSPNMKFATVFVGVLAVLVFWLSFWQAVAALVLGNALGAVFHGVFASWGPRTGLAGLLPDPRGRLPGRGGAHPSAGPDGHRRIAGAGRRPDRRGHGLRAVGRVVHLRRGLRPLPGPTRPAEPACPPPSDSSPRSRSCRSLEPPP